MRAVLPKPARISSLVDDLQRLLLRPPDLAEGARGQTSRKFVGPTPLEARPPTPPPGRLVHVERTTSLPLHSSAELDFYLTVFWEQRAAAKYKRRDESVYVLKIHRTDGRARRLN